MYLSPYVRAAVERELASLSSTGPGNRARATFATAAALGGFVASGHLAFDAVYDWIVERVVALGHSAKEAQSNTRNGLKRGMAAPRDVPGGDDVRAHYAPAAPPTATAQRSDRPTPPHNAVLAIWATCVPVTEDDEAATMLQRRALDPDLVALWDGARVLPPRAALPTWAGRGRVPWSQSNHRLLVPLYDENGRLASFRARSLGDAPFKSLAPAGFRSAGLVFADGMSQQVLRRQVPDWWTPSFVIAEGEMNWLTWVTRQPECQEQGHAVLGVVGGSWRQGFVGRLPPNAPVVIRADPDEAGDAYVEKIARSLLGRCVVHCSARNRAS